MDSQLVYEFLKEAKDKKAFVSFSIEPIVLMQEHFLIEIHDAETLMEMYGEMTVPTLEYIEWLERRAKQSF